MSLTYIALLCRLGGPPAFPNPSMGINLFSFAVSLISAVGCFQIFFFIIGAPLRRAERIRAFLEAVLALHDAGLPIERKLLELAKINVRLPVPSSRLREWIWPRNAPKARFRHPFGSAFLKVTKHLEKGVPLQDALERETSFLPSSIRRSLVLGLQTDDLATIRMLTKEPVPGATSRVLSMANYFLVPTFVFGLVICAGFGYFIVPKFKMMMSEMGGGRLEILDSFLFALNLKIVLFAPIVAIVALFGGVILHVWGWRLMNNPSWNSLGSLVFYYLFPWRRWRMTAAFSKNLAHLIRVGVHEKDALIDAALSTDNRVMIRRARRGVTSLERGDSLLTVLTKEFDHGGELSWRLANLLRSGCGDDRFTESVDGWCSYLDAKAFRMEQAAGQLISTTLILFTSVMVAVFAFAMFRSLMAIVENMVLW